MEPGSFEEQFRLRLVPLLRALERRRARAEDRRGALAERRMREGSGEGEGRDEGRWRQVREAYSKAHDSLRASADWTWTAAVLLLKIKDDEERARSTARRPPEGD